MSPSQVFSTIQTLLASRTLPNAGQCSYEHNLDRAIALVKDMHKSNLEVIERTAKLLQSVGVN